MTYVLAVDQGTTSTRAILFDHGGNPVATGQREHRQIMPRAGWVEHDATEIWTATRRVVAEAMATADAAVDDVVAVGLTNQRETTVVWDRATGKPISNAIVWQDTRTDAIVKRLTDALPPEEWQRRTGLKPSTYFAGTKIAWILENVEGAHERAEAGELAFGTMDTWIAWNMTGGAKGGVHVTDVTNASRTLLMDIRTLQWDPELCELVGVPESMLPEIHSSSEVYGTCRAGGGVPGVPLAGILGDQHAATFGQACFEVGAAKNTYGTGNFMLLTTGEEPVFSERGLLTTVAYKVGEAPAMYALEGSIAVTGSLIQWLRDNLGLISSAPEVEKLALTVDDNGGAYIVPAFSGLFAPHWRPDARGAVVGLTRYVNKGHLARASLEAVAYQTRDVLEAMDQEVEAPLTEMRVDGGMVANELLMQFQADILGVDVVRPRVTETTALGAAYAAGIAVGFWEGVEDVASQWEEEKRFTPSMDEGERERLYRQWGKAVERTLDWVDEDVV